MIRNLLPMSYLFIALFLMLGRSQVTAEVPDIVLEQKDTTVTIYVNDKDGDSVALGRGFIVDQNGVIVTNCQVIARWLEEVENTLSVEIEGNVTFPLEYLLFSKCKHNIALFTIEAQSLPAATFITDYKPKPGESIFIIGSSSELETHISEGVIRNVGRRDKLIPISIPVTQEWSGSPVFNIKGEVIGIATSLTKRGKNYSFAVPMRDIAKQIDRYKNLESSLKPISEFNTELLNIKKEAEENPNDLDALFLLGSMYDELSMHKEAIEAYQQSLLINPDFAEAYENIGTAYYKLGRYDEAINAYKQAIQIEDSSCVYNKIGGMYLIKGEYSMALDAFKKAVDLDPNNAEVHFNLGIAYYINGESVAAFREYRVLKDLDEERANRLVEIMYY